MFSLSQINFFRTILQVFLHSGAGVSSIRQKSISIIRRTLGWVVASATLMLISTLSQVIVIYCFAYNYYANWKHLEYYYFAFVVIISTCRIGLAFTKVLNCVC
jgi:hypothetical protein